MKQTKFRIVPMCDAKGLRYYIQYKGTFFWTDYRTPVYGPGYTGDNGQNNSSWHTVEGAVKYIKEKYGQNARIVTWRG